MNCDPKLIFTHDRKHKFKHIYYYLYFRGKYIKYNSDVMQTELEAAIIASSSPGDQVTRVNINYIN